MRERLLKEVSAAAKKLGEELIALLVPELERIRDRAVEDAKAKIRVDLEALTEPPKPELAPIAKPRKKRRRSIPVVAPAVTPTISPSSSGSRARARAVPRASTAPQGTPRAACSVCQQPGHNARTCPKRGAAIAKTPTIDREEPPAPRLSTADRASLEKPCRDPNCRIVKLHATHGEAA